MARRDQAALAVLITQAAKPKSLGPRRAMFLNRLTQSKQAGLLWQPSAAAPFTARSAVIAAHAPHEAAVEEVFVNMNPSSTLKLGHARACALIAPARAGLPVAEYATRLVKKAVVGTGAAEKAQIAFMVRRLLPSAGETCSDSADALAVAIAHAHLRTHALRAAS